jgi:Major Facilitator Superfamily
VMLQTDLLRCAVLAILAAVTWQGGLGFAGLVLAAAAGGMLTVGFELARSAWIAQRVGAEALPKGNAQLSVTGAVSETVAFALGGWVYQGLGAAVALAADAATYLLSALCLRGVREVPGTPRAPTARGRWQVALQEATAGLRAVTAQPRLRALAVIEALVHCMRALYGTSFMIYASRDLALPTGTLGMIFAVGGLGSVLGAGLAPGLGRRLGPGRTMTLGLMAYAAGAACVPMAEGAGWAAVGWLLAQQVVGDAGHSLHDVHDRTLRQTAVPAALLARTDAGIRSVGYVATLAGALVGGSLGTVWDARSVLWLAAVAAATAAGWAAWHLAERAAAAPRA